MATKTVRGFRVTCPFCGDREAKLSVNLNDLPTIACAGCDEEFSPRQALEIAQAEAARWEAIVKWVESAEPAE
jgi:hypothetical protein